MAKGSNNVRKKTKRSGGEGTSSNTTDHPASPVAESAVEPAHLGKQAALGWAGKKRRYADG